MIRQSVAFIFLAIAFSACTTEEIGNSRDVNPDAVYTSYTTTYKEGALTLSNKAQFRFAGPDGTTLVLNDKSNVQFDGVSLPVDSNQYNGAYYETLIPVATFTGTHAWKFTDINGKVYEEQFVFEPVSLQTAIPATIKVDDLSLIFTGTTNGDSITVAITDTSSATMDEDKKYLVKNKAVVIPAAVFKQLAPGPLTFEFFCKKSRRLKNSPKEGGNLVLEFEPKGRTTTLEQ